MLKLIWILYALKCHDIETVANPSGRYDLKTGLKIILEKNLWKESWRKVSLSWRLNQVTVRLISHVFKYLNWCRKNEFERCFREIQGPYNNLFVSLFWTCYTLHALTVMSKSWNLPWFLLLYTLLRLLNYFLKKLGALFSFNLLLRCTSFFIVKQHWHK